MSEPQRAGHPVLPQFRFCWAKLGLWALCEYGVVVYMDADMLPLGDLRPLLDFAASLPHNSIAAVAACQCWCGEDCSYTPAAPATEPAMTCYFNAGLLMLRPSKAELASMRDALAACDRPMPFAEQDFLNEYFSGRVVKIPAAFNALKPALVNPKHCEALPLNSCVVLHYVMAKPWERLSRHEPELAHVHQLWHDAWKHRAATIFKRPTWLDYVVDPRLPGLWCVPEFVAEEMEGALTEFLHGAEQPGGRSWQRLSKRRVLCLGGVPHPEGAILERLPGPVGQVAAFLSEAIALPGAPANQCLANAYSAGEGIDPHFDGPAFKSAAAVLTLEGPAILHFRLVDWRARPELPRLLEVVLRPRSLLVFHGLAYEEYVHWIEHTPLESSSMSGEIISRAPRRTSLTFRHLGTVQLPPEAVATAEQRAARDAQWEWWRTQLGEID